jgi:hypothetical protein
MELSESDLEFSAKFAIRVRKAIRDPERWALVVANARGLIGCATDKPLPPEMNEVTILAIAYVTAMHCARQLPPEDATHREAVEILRTIAECV